MKKLFLLLAVFLLVTTNPACGLERFDIVTTEEMQQLLEDREAEKIDFILVNTLEEMIFRDAAIPGSINIPLGRIETNIQKLGRDKEKLIVMY